MSEQPVLYVVMKRHSWEGHETIHAYLERADAEEHRDRLNGEPYDIDDMQRYYVSTLPFGPVAASAS